MTDQEPSPDPLIGSLIDRKYRIDRLIGRGGMGAVYEATHTAIGKRVALKFLAASEDRDAVRRFQREAEAASAVESAHIVQIFDSGTTEDDQPYLVMELLRGEDLRERITRLGQLPEPEVLQITAQTLRALIRAHAAGIVHRDLKPDNLFLSEQDDGSLFVKVVDFGISKVVQTRATANTLTRQGTVLGTAYYMAPEQAQAFPDIDGRADLYSLGAICFEALTGQPPHDGRTYEAILVKACTQDAPDPRGLAPALSSAFAAVVQKALARERSERFTSAAAFLEALAEVSPDLRASGTQIVGFPAPARARSESGLTGSGSVVPATTSPPHRPRLVVTALVAGLAAFAGTALWLGRPTTPGGAPASAASAQEPADLSSLSDAAAPVTPTPDAQAGAASSPSADSSPNAASSATAASSASSASSATAAAPRPRPTPRPSTLAPKPTPKPAGVAPGLGLNPKEP